MPRRAASPLTGDDPYIVDYFRDELLARESPETVRFLMRTAAARRDVRRALRPRARPQRLRRPAGRGGATEPLRRPAGPARRVVPLPPPGRRDAPVRAPATRARRGVRGCTGAPPAGTRARSPEKAIGHALAGRRHPHRGPADQPACADFVAAGRLPYGPRMAGRPGRRRPRRAIRRWRSRRPGCWRSVGDAQGAQRCLHAAERGSFDGPLPDGSSSLASAITVLRASLGALGVDRMLLDARAATEMRATRQPMVPGGDGDARHRPRAQRRCRCGGQGARPGGPARPGGQLPYAAVTALAELSLLAAERDDWPGAEEKAGQAVDLIETAGMEEHLFSILGFVAAARVAAHQGNQVAARRHAGTVVRMYATPSPAAIPWLSAQVAITLAETFLDLGDYAAARVPDRGGPRTSRRTADRRSAPRAAAAGLGRPRPAGRPRPGPERDGADQGGDAGAATAADPPLPRRDRRRAATPPGTP